MTVTCTRESDGQYVRCPESCNTYTRWYLLITIEIDNGFWHNITANHSTPISDIDLTKALEASSRTRIPRNCPANCEISLLPFNSAKLRMVEEMKTWLNLFLLLIGLWDAHGLRCTWTCSPHSRSTMLCGWSGIGSSWQIRIYYLIMAYVLSEHYQWCYHWLEIRYAKKYLESWSY